jgi:hypothetical protein
VSAQQLITFLSFSFIYFLNQQFVFNVALLLLPLPVLCHRPGVQAETGFFRHLGKALTIFPGRDGLQPEYHTPLLWANGNAVADRAAQYMIMRSSPPSSRFRELFSSTHSRIPSHFRNPATRWLIVCNSSINSYLSGALAR